jgi:hypothetical protein
VADAAKLALGPWGDVAFTWIDTADLAYGMSWTDLVGLASDVDELIACAAVVGRLGFCESGIAFAPLAAHLDLVADANKCLDAGRDSEALFALDPTLFREYAAICLDIVADLEERTAALHAKDLDAAPRAGTRQVSVGRDEAIERAAKARERGRLIRRDMK